MYGIRESLISGLLQGKSLPSGKHDIVEKVERFTYPIKIVVVVQEDMITVVTSYPLKKGTGI